MGNAVGGESPAQHICQNLSEDVKLTEEKSWAIAALFF